MNDRPDPLDAVRAAYERMAPACTLCPRLCRVDRLSGEKGHCATGWEPFVASVGPHFGEEEPLVGTRGSGTIFLSGCNLHCVFCQNYDISDADVGTSVSVARLSDAMLGLQRFGCHNVNFVTPTHQSAAVMEAVLKARNAGLTVPIVYNCGGYESVDTLRLLEGFVEIYMPDMKFDDHRTASRLCRAPDYPEVSRQALREMHRQVGDLEIRDGVAVRGLLVRHLVMPDGVEEGKAIMDFLAEEISPSTYVNVMPQYRPMHKAYAHPGIDRAPTRKEFQAVRRHAQALGLRLAR